MSNHETTIARSSSLVSVSVSSSQDMLAALVRPSRRRSWKTYFGLTLGVVSVAAAIAMYQPWQRLLASPISTETSVSAAPRSVNVVTPAPAKTANIVLPATFRPWQSAVLHARVSGYVTAWHRDLGASVKTGELLAEIETPELDQEVAEGESLAREAEAAAVQALAEKTEAEAEVKVAEAQLARAKAEYELTQTQLVRRDKLLQSKAVSQEEFDTFQRQMEARTADVDAAESDVTRRRKNLETRNAIIAAREAVAKSRQSNVERLKELQRFKRIVAPFDGVITSRTAEVGTLVSAGQGDLFVIEDLNRIRVRIQVPQTYAMQTSAGVVATVSLPESGMEPIRGSITRVAESVDPASRTMLAEIELDNAARHLQPGSYAQVTLAAPQNRAEWTIPTNTLSMRADGVYVAFVDSSNRIEIKPVTLGRDLGNRVVVTDGIRGKERLVVNPSDDLTSGTRVDVRAPVDATQNVAQR